MKKEEFDTLSVDHKLEYIKIMQELATDSIRRRMEILPSASALSSMLLIVATFGDKVIPYNTLVKFLLSILLAVIPISLFFYNLDLKTAVKKNVSYVDSLLGTDTKKEIVDKQGCISKFISYFPDVVIYVLAIIIAILIYSMWVR